MDMVINAFENDGRNLFCGECGERKVNCHCNCQDNDCKRCYPCDFCDQKLCTPCDKCDSDCIEECKCPIDTSAYDKWVALCEATEIAKEKWEKRATIQCCERCYTFTYTQGGLCYICKEVK